MDLASILEGFSASKIDQNRYQFRDRFLEGLQMCCVSLRNQSGAPGPPLRTPKGVLTGLHTVVQLSEGLGLWNRGLVLALLHAVCRWHGDFVVHPLPAGNAHG